MFRVTVFLPSPNRLVSSMTRGLGLFSTSQLLLAAVTGVSENRGILAYLLSFVRLTAGELGFDIASVAVAPGPLVLMGFRGRWMANLGS